MPIQTNLNVSPYYDDFDVNSDYYKILFRPGVAVQARELNQLQTILQNQVEQFGDNIFKTGTIIEGCQFLFHDKLPYVKIKDNETTGAPVVLSAYKNLYVKNSANVQALVVTSLAGFESRDPDLNTLYVKYLNSGTSSSTTAFAADQVLTIFDPDNIIFKVNISDGAAGFTDSDSVVFMSALEVQNTTGGVTFANGFNVGDTINNGTSANAVITAVDSASNTECVILRVRPLANNLAQANSTLWTFSANQSIQSSNTSPETAIISGFVGAGASGTLVTDNIGQVARITVTSNGRGYYVLPHVTVSSSTANTVEIAEANLVPQSYMSQITVAGASVVDGPVGYGYGMSISSGVIYQKGYFSRVEEQLLVVEKYGNPDSVPALPDGVVVGFDTREDVINSNIDTALLDNALGTYNYAAPGADRLKLTPQLAVLTKAEADANSDFFAVVEFSEGYPFKQNRETQYNVIGDEMARRTFDESGNYVIDTFQAATSSEELLANDITTFEVIVDPGKAYIDGYRVENLYNKVTSVNKGTDTETASNQGISLAYGSYVDVQQVGGQFNFSLGDKVDLYDTAKQYISTSAGSTITTSGALIGYARIRHAELISGTSGTAEATYRLYLFMIEMSAGKNFKNVKSVYYNGTTEKGIADVIQTYDVTTTSYITVIGDASSSAMTFPTGRAALKSISNASYTYSTTISSKSANTLGQWSHTLTGPDETFYNTGVLSATTRRGLLVVPTANAIAAANITGTITTSPTSNAVTGSGTSFVSELEAGDYITFNSVVKQISSIANSTSLTLTQNSGASGSSNAQIYFPQYVPIAMDNPIRGANVDVAGTTLTIDLGVALTSSVNLSVTYDVFAANVQPVSTSINRNSYIRLNLSTHNKTTKGPWPLGFSDVIRLKGVYKGANSSFNASDSGVTDVTNDFVVNSGQKADVVDIATLEQKPTSTLTLTSADYLLVKFDHLSISTTGMRNVLSYITDPATNDVISLESATSSIHTLEIPEFKDKSGTYYDMRDQVDFRPTVANTVAITTTANVSTPVNPGKWTTATRTFVSGNNKFPTPNSLMRANIVTYVGRVDRVIVNKEGDIEVITGEPGSYDAPPLPIDALNINTIVIPPYPSVPDQLNQLIVNINDVRTNINQNGTLRAKNFGIQLQASTDQISRSQPRGYTMQEIGDLERRISDLEYYTALTMAETDVKNKVIPGVGGVDRYKFGFLVDSFNDSATADIGHKEHRASILEGRLQSKVDVLILEQDTVDMLSFNYNEFNAYGQKTATDGAIPVPVTTTTTTTTTTVAPKPVQRTASQVVALYGTQFNTNCSVYEDREFVFSESSGAASFLFCFEDAVGVVEVYYGTTPGFTPTGTPKYTSANAVALTNAEKNELTKADAVIFPEVNWTKNIQTRSVCSGKVALDYSLGKISWTHNPAFGQYVKIRVIRHSAYSEFFSENINKGKWRNHPPYAYIAKWPSDSAATTVIPPTVTPGTFTYNGTFSYAYPKAFTITNKDVGYIPPGSTSYTTLSTSDSEKFTFHAWGLKPHTNYTFTFDGKDQTAKCQSFGYSTTLGYLSAGILTWGVASTLGAGIKSDQWGHVSFYFFYDAGIDEGASTYADRVKLAQSAVGVKNYSVQNTDGSSKATGNIEIKQASMPQTRTLRGGEAKVPTIINLPYVVHGGIGKSVISASVNTGGSVWNGIRDESRTFKSV